MTARRLVLTWSVGAAVIVALVVAGIAYGSTPLASGDLARALTQSLLPGLDTGGSPAIMRIVIDLRLPRVLLAICVGSGLAVVGALLQTTTRNDLADPFLFGLSSGAAAGAVSVITIFGDRLGIWTLPAAAFAGALLSACAVLALIGAQRDKGPERLVIAGLAVSFLFGAVTTYLVFAGDQRAAHSVLFWSVGGLGLASWSNLPLGLAGAAVAVGTGIALRHRLDALLSGDDTALSLGVDVPRLRFTVFAISALATAALVSLSGVIGFVGLMVPHLARAMVGVRHGALIVTAAVIGAIMLLAGDLASRIVLAPQELPVGIITAAAGALFVLGIVLKR
ncbi:FecCD family ABC transporter permease [Mesorhizobium australafricanum]|uniref:Iron ABC transporter permease n=1 Tax=Mesorhizobium australafricanum TaxID=3072311 RepID=A0ABU4WW26_9HYPH|nr:iron ABC transporter permease [Mesorhizobium sp. VK3E]MDX8439463.1 iron ABC transporter permease [Mesorhizobium sp. VK3E]